MGTQLDLFSPATTDYSSPPLLFSYDHFIVCFSGGKDSIALVLHLLEMGVPKERIELWHHIIDGREGSKLMDWAVTTDYCRKFAKAFKLKIYYSWRIGGFEREMLRNNSNTAPVCFERPDGSIGQSGGVRNSPGTRLKFPQVSGDLSVRWCSAYLKIMVCNAAIAAQKRFIGKRIIVLTGERGEESEQRAKYHIFEPHKTTIRKRHVDHWRPLLTWTEQQVWELIEFWKVRVHPAYYLGFNRTSCAACIFASANQFATLAAINPSQVEQIAAYEKKFGVTIKRNKSISTLVKEGKPHSYDKKQEKLAMSESYTCSIFIENWQLPTGAYGESCQAR